MFIASTVFANSSLQISSIPLEKSNDVEFILELLKKEPLAYKNVSPSLRNNSEIVITFLKHATQDKDLNNKTNDKIKKELYLEVATNKNINLDKYEGIKYLIDGMSVEWLRDKKFVLDFINKGNFSEINFPGVEPDPQDRSAVDLYASRNAPDFPEFYVYIKSKTYLGDDKDITLALFKKYLTIQNVLIFLDKSAFDESFIKKHMQSYKTFFTERWMNRVYENFVKNTKYAQNKKFALSSVKKYGFLLKYFPDFQNDKEVVLASQSGVYAYDNCEYDGCYTIDIPFQYASEKLKDDKDILKSFLKRDPKALQYASDRLKDDLNIVTEILEKNLYYNLDPQEPGWELHTRELPTILLASDRIKETIFDNEKIMTKYISDNYKFIERTSPRLKNNAEFIENVLKVCEKYQTDRKVERRSVVIENMSDQIRKNYQ